MKTLEAASQVLNGKLSGEGDGLFDRVSIDSRIITDGSNQLFIALNGKQHDGHKYIDEAYKKGIRSFIVERDFSLPNAAFLKVENTLEAFQKLAKAHRESWSNPCIAITGSNGKTTVKEWLANCLSKSNKVHRSPRSYNSQIGVAISLLDGDDSADFHILEAGISQPGEMNRLEKMIQPE
ncbi:MAG: Mur ligase family protein, partial [Flavobacteriales bacterium]